MNHNPNIFEVGPYQFQTVEIEPLINCIEILIETFSAQEVVCEHRVEILATDKVAFFRTLLELECCAKLLDRKERNLQQVFWKQHMSKLIQEPWGWLNDFPYDGGLCTHSTISDYCIYHYDEKGAKKEIRVQEQLSAIVLEIKNFNQNNDQNYAAHCEAMIEREILALGVQCNSQKTSTFKI